MKQTLKELRTEFKNAGSCTHFHFVANRSDTWGKNGLLHKRYKFLSEKSTLSKKKPIEENDVKVSNTNN